MTSLSGGAAAPIPRGRAAAAGPQPPAPIPRGREAAAGFTLLEVLVATVITAIAVVTLLSGISTSLRNAARLTDHDRAVLIARSKMDELLLDRKLPRHARLEGRIDPSLLDGHEGGWVAQLGLFETVPNPGPGTLALERLQLEIWWQAGGQRRSFALDGFRPATLRPEDFPQ